MIRKTNIDKEVSKRFNSELIEKTNIDKKVIKKSDSEKTAKDNKITVLEFIFNSESFISEYMKK